MAGVLHASLLGAIEGFRSVTEIGSGLSNSVTPGTASVTCPTTVPGDILVAILWGGNGPPGDTVPSGFTKAATQTDANRRITLCARICDGTEGGSTISGFNGSSFSQVHLTHLRLDHAPSGGTITGGQASSITSGNPSAIQVAAASPARPTLALAAYLSSGAVDPRTFTPTKDGERPFATNVIYIAWKLIPLGGTAVDIDMDDEGDPNVVLGGRIDLVP